MQYMQERQHQTTDRDRGSLIANKKKTIAKQYERCSKPEACHLLLLSRQDFDKKVKVKYYVGIGIDG
jgi:hypothetical protein